MDTAQIALTTVILATDEASSYLQATTKVVWHPQGQTPIIKLHPGRESTHFYGALNLETGQETALRTSVTNAEITALVLLRSQLNQDDSQTRRPALSSHRSPTPAR